MKTKYFFPFFLILMIQACTSCGSSEATKCKKDYSFEIAFTLSPALDTFTLQDTIWIESTIEQKLLDLKSGDSIFIDTFDFKLYSNIIRIIDTIGFVDGENSFKYLNKIGQFQVFNYSFGSEAHLLYAREPGRQKIRFGIIPLEEGVYNFDFFNLTDDLLNVDFPEDCSVNITKLNKRMNTGTNNNFHLVKDFYEEFFPNSDFNEDEFNHGGGYAFVVVE